MTTASTFLSVPSDKLNATIEQLLSKTRMSWLELETAAESFSLNDEDLATYRTIKSIRWVTLGE